MTNTVFLPERKLVVVCKRLGDAVAKKQLPLAVAGRCLRGGLPPPLPDNKLNLIRQRLKEATSALAGVGCEVWPRTPQAALDE